MISLKEHCRILSAAAGPVIGTKILAQFNGSNSIQLKVFNGI